MSTISKTAKLLRMRARMSTSRTEAKELHIKAAWLESKVLSARGAVEPEESGAAELRGSSNIPAWFKRLKRGLKCMECGGSTATWYTAQLRRPRLFAFLAESGHDTHAEDVLKYHLKHSLVLCRECLTKARAARAESVPCDSNSCSPLK